MASSVKPRKGELAGDAERPRPATAPAVDAPRETS